MIVILKPDMGEKTPEYRQILDFLAHKPNIKTRVHQEIGTQQTLTEIYLIGDTASLDKTEIESLPGVERVVRVSEEYRVLGRHRDDRRPTGFEYNGVKFSQDNLNVFAGLCAVDNPEHVEMMLKALRDNGQVCTRMGAYKPRTNPYSFQGHGKEVCTRMGAYKPRTNPYSFQGHGKECLPWVFELAGKYGIKVIAMEITHDSHLHEIQEALHQTGKPTGVMIQIGTRNTQNFELLKIVGRQRQLPVLLKRGFGITLEESLNAAEYLASEGASE